MVVAQILQKYNRYIYKNKKYDKVMIGEVDMNMEKLAKNILALENNHTLSKVRFAKTIYFVHKELIRNNLLSKDFIQYIRMPLGPVPFGFMQITKSCPEITSIKRKTGLAYETENYSTKSDYDGNEQEKTVILGTLETLRKFQTSNLVDTSHKDPSWLSHQNSEHYYITDDDMKNDLSILEALFVNDGDDEEDKLQASLVRGMIKDIVSESTKLEYPA